MKYLIFKGESNDFTEILSDNVIKTRIKTKIKWESHLMIGFSDIKDSIYGYIVLKYGDCIVDDIIVDFSPKLGIDYHLTK